MNRPLEVAAPAGPGRWRAAAMLVLKLAVTLGLLVWMESRVDLAVLGAAWGRLQASTLLAALACLVAQQLVLAWRWHRVAHWLGSPWPWRTALRWMLVGLFFNQALPSSVGGDAVRVWGMRAQGVPTELALGSVVVERVSGLAVMAVMIALAVLAAPRGVGGPVVERALLLGCLILVGLTMAVVFVDKWFTRWLPGRWSDQGARLGRSMRELFRRPRAAVEVLMSGGLATWLGLWTSVLLGRGLGIDQPASVFFAILGSATVLTLLPVSLGGWGVREAVVVGLFTPLGAEPGAALTLSLLCGILPLALALPGALAYWLGGRGTGLAGTLPTDRPSR